MLSQYLQSVSQEKFEIKAQHAGLLKVLVNMRMISIGSMLPICQCTATSSCSTQPPCFSPRCCSAGSCPLACTPPWWPLGVSDLLINSLLEVWRNFFGQAIKNFRQRLAWIFASPTFQRNFIFSAIFFLYYGNNTSGNSILYFSNVISFNINRYFVNKFISTLAIENRKWHYKIVFCQYL